MRNLAIEVTTAWLKVLSSYRLAVNVVIAGIPLDALQGVVPLKTITKFYRAKHRPVVFVRVAFLMLNDTCNWCQKRPAFLMLSDTCNWCQRSEAQIAVLHHLLSELIHIRVEVFLSVFGGVGD